MRWLVRSLFALLVLVILGVGSLFLIPTEKIAGLAVAKFNALTGRELVLSGTTRPSFWPQLGVTTGPVSVSNADWSDQGPMVQAEGLSIGLDMAALLGGTVKITGIEAIAPKIVLERSKSGKENWVFGGDNGGEVTAATPGVGAAFTLDKGLIHGGTLLFIDHATGQRVEMSGIEAAVAIPDYVGAASVDLAAVMNGQPFAAVAEVGAFQAFLDGKVVPLELTITAGAAEVAFAGRAGHGPLEAEGELTADLADLAAVSALAGLTRPALPEGLGADRVTVAGSLTLTAEHSAHLRGGKVELDANALAVDADLTTGGDRPKLSAKVVAGDLALAALTQGGGAQAAGWPDSRIDVGGLGVMDAAIALTATSLDLGAVKTGAVAAMITIDRARAVFDIRKMAAYEGAISGQFVVNGRKGLSVGGDLSFAGMALQPLLSDFGGYERLIGTGDLRVEFLGVGNSVDAIMQGLKGSGALTLTKGELRGLDIAGMLRSFDTSYVGEGQKTIFDSVAGSFEIADGVLRNEDLLLKSPYITATGAGDVGLGARDLDYRVKATALADDTGAGGLTAPLMITGPWAKPRFALDLEALAAEQLADEKAALEAAAQEKAAALEAEAKAKLEAELGIVQQDGETLEDAARRRAQEALDDEARRILEQLLNRD
jgi:AsmA protein